MNDRIKELALKSGIAYLSEHTAYFQANDGLTVLPSVSSLEKFSELLLRDVAQFIEDKFDFCGDEIVISEAVLKQFGVEESKGWKPTGWICPKCGIDRGKDVCPKGHSAALTGECPMVGEAQ